MFFQIYIFFLQLRNIFPYYAGPTIVQCINNENMKLTVGKEYESERRDRISYYLKDDEGVLQEVTRNKFILIKKLK